MPIDSFARQISTLDFIQFTHILAADENNLHRLNQIKPLNTTAEVRLWGSYDDNEPIPDPYYGGMVCCNQNQDTVLQLMCFQSGFEKVFKQCVRLSNAFLDEVTGNKPTV